MSARANILNRIRRAERTGHVPTQAPLPPPFAAAKPSGADNLRRFAAELQALGVDIFVEDSDDAVRARIVALVGSQPVLQWDTAALPYGVGSLFPWALTGKSPRDAQASAAIGLTGADAAIAETGSLVLLSGQGKPRAASLLPQTHIAVVQRSGLYASMGEFFAAHADAIARAACCTFVTGPSRTADIELTLTLGVHGPGTVIVVVGP
jgi:L-lactate dehydrogenase complex protein LldG